MENIVNRLAGCARGALNLFALGAGVSVATARTYLLQELRNPLGGVLLTTQAPDR